MSTGRFDQILGNSINASIAAEEEKWNSCGGTETFDMYVSQNPNDLGKETIEAGASTSYLGAVAFTESVSSQQNPIEN